MLIAQLDGTKNHKTFRERNIYIVIIHLYMHEILLLKKGNVCATGADFIK